MRIGAMGGMGIQSPRKHPPDRRIASRSWGPEAGPCDYPRPALGSEMGAEGRPHCLDLDEEGVVTIGRIQFDIGHGDSFRFE